MGTPHRITMGSYEESEALGRQFADAAGLSVLSVTPGDKPEMAVLELDGTAEQFMKFRADLSEHLWPGWEH